MVRLEDDHCIVDAGSQHQSWSMVAHRFHGYQPAHLAKSFPCWPKFFNIGYYLMFRLSTAQILTHKRRDLGRLEVFIYISCSVNSCILSRKHTDTVRPWWCSVMKILMMKKMQDWNKKGKCFEISSMFWILNTRILKLLSYNK